MWRLAIYSSTTFRDFILKIYDKRKKVSWMASVSTVYERLFIIYFIREGTIHLKFRLVVFRWNARNRYEVLGIET